MSDRTRVIGLLPERVSDFNGMRTLYRRSRPRCHGGSGSWPATRRRAAAYSSSKYGVEPEVHQPGVRMPVYFVRNFVASSSGRISARPEPVGHVVTNGDTG